MSYDRIQSDPNVMFGKPVIKGTRITVKHILRCFASGDSAADIIDDHPGLTLDDIRQAQGYAADFLGSEERIFAAE